MGDKEVKFEIYPQHFKSENKSQKKILDWRGLGLLCVESKIREKRYNVFHVFLWKAHVKFKLSGALVNPQGFKCQKTKNLDEDEKNMLCLVLQFKSY